MKYLITGGSGFIGTNLISFLQKKYPTCSILNIDTSSPRNVNQSKYWINCDIMDFDKLLIEFKNFDPSYVVNLAAKQYANYPPRKNRFEYRFSCLQ